VMDFGLGSGLGLGFSLGLGSSGRVSDGLSVRDRVRARAKGELVTPATWMRC
jgi:hypothetical protein